LVKPSKANTVFTNYNNREKDLISTKETIKTSFPMNSSKPLGRAIQDLHTKSSFNRRTKTTLQQSTNIAQEPEKEGFK